MGKLYDLIMNSPPSTEPFVLGLQAKMASAVEYRIMRDVIHVVEDLLPPIDGKPPEVRAWPDHISWYEAQLDDGISGLLVFPHLSDHRAAIFTAARGADGVNIVAANIVDGDLRVRPMAERTPSRADHPLDDRAWLTQAQGFQIILSLMENPLLVEARPVVYDAALQRARAKRGKPPLRDYSEVVIHVTRQERVEREAAADHQHRTGVRLHYVRPFFRTRLGTISRVRAHWRGLAGTLPAKPTYRVTL